MLESLTPSIIPSNINTSVNGVIYIFATETSTQNNELWSYDTSILFILNTFLTNEGGNTWAKIEDSGSLVMTPGERHTMSYKNQILSISADLQNVPSIEIQYATLSNKNHSL